MEKARNQRLWLLKVFAIVSLFFGLQSQSHAVEITLGWDANTEPKLAGYRVYYKMSSSGDRVLDSYNGEGLILAEESGTTRVVNSGFEISGVSCHLSGLDGGTVYFFVVTSFNTEGLQSLASREVANDDIPPSKPSILWSSHIPGLWSSDTNVKLEWSPSIDAVPGSGMAGYSYVLDTFSNTTPDTLPRVSGVTEITLYTSA